MNADALKEIEEVLDFFSKTYKVVKEVVRNDDEGIPLQYGGLRDVLKGKINFPWKTVSL